MNPFRIYVVSLIALAVGTTAVYQHTQKSDINFYQGHRLFARGEYRSAESFLEKSLYYSPSRTDASRDLGYCYLWTGRHDMAIYHFERIIREGRPVEDDKRALANAYAWSKRYEEAESILRELVLTTDKTGYKRRLARVYVWTRQYDKAKDILNEVIKKDPSDIKAKVIMARAFLYSDEPDKAIPLLEAALSGLRSENEQ